MGEFPPNLACVMTLIIDSGFAGSIFWFCVIAVVFRLCVDCVDCVDHLHGLFVSVKSSDEKSSST